tara:strand:- start:1931 stop:2359 length:429 start_codon:yes stop_codon:yes gene_type:complete
MILISHRGNTSGSNSELENKPEYIMNTLQKGYDVEIDVWSVDKQFYLGHDEPQYKIERSFLQNKKFWCHAKNIESFYRMIDDKKIHCFFHDKDKVALTSKGYFWSSSKNEMTNKSICVMPPLSRDVPNYVAGVCSDYIERYK